MLFHVSESRNLNYLTPKVPRIPIGTIEDHTTPRICFAPSINCCLRGIILDCGINYISYKNHSQESPVNNTNDMNKLELMMEHDPSVMILSNSINKILREGESLYQVYYAYVPVGVQYGEFYHPSVEEVFDVEITREVWLKKACKIKRIASFIVTGGIEIGTFNYKDKFGNDRSYPIIDYSYMPISDQLASIINRYDKIDKDRTIEEFKLSERLKNLEDRFNNHIDK